jgi:hypothetical protein
VTEPVDPAIAALRATFTAVPATRAAIDALLDRVESRGGRAGRVTIEVDPVAVAPLCAIFRARAVRSIDDRRVRIDLTRAPDGVIDRLYVAVARVARDRVAERRRAIAELELGLSRLPRPSSPVAGAYLTSLREDPAAVRALAVDYGPANASHRVGQVLRVLDAIAALTEPLRLANFAARVLRDSKALLPGSELHREVGLALVTHDPLVQAEVAARQPRSTAHAVGIAFEHHGLVRDLASVLVHAWGPLVYAIGEVVFRHVADHARLGVPTPLSLAQLHRARVVDLDIDRITLFENQAPFLDYLERTAPARELVVFARGQATWAVVTLLRRCARPGVTIRHAGDLDRSGVLIVRSLAARARLPIEPWHMDAATHARFADRGRPLDSDERERLARLLAVDDPAAPCHDLLAAIHASGVWIEQEAISHDLWIPPPHEIVPTTTR